MDFISKNLYNSTMSEDRPPKIFEGIIILLSFNGCNSFMLFPSSVAAFLNSSGALFSANSFNNGRILTNESIKFFLIPNA